MATPPGNYDIRTRLNEETPVARRMRRGNWTNTVINAINALTAQNDVLLAVSSGAMIYNTGGGTLTVAGTVANGDSFTTTFTCATLPLLVAGLVVGPVNIVTADTVTTIAAKLAAAINASTILTSYGFSATSAVGVVTLHAPGAAGTATTITRTLSAGAVITVTIVNPTGGTGAVVARSATAYALTPLSQL